MKLEKIVTWLDQTLNIAAFDDVSNNGIQIERDQGLGIRDQGSGIGDQVKIVAFAVDASVKAVKAAAKAGAQLLVVHHGISWGGGIKRIEGGVYNVVKAAMDANLAIYACHLPLDAHPVLGNNAQLAKLLGLKRVKPAFSYHGNVIGLVGKCSNVRMLELAKRLGLEISDSNIQTFKHSNIDLVGICSGGAGEFAEEAKRLGCDLYLTGEASWGDVIAAENCGMEMICAGHYETEVFGVRAVAEKMGKALKLKVIDLTEKLSKNGERFSARKRSVVAAVVLALTALTGLGSVDNPDPSTFGGNAYHDGGWISYGTDINQKNGYLQFDSGSDYVYSPHYAAPIRKIMMETRCSSSSSPTRFLTVMPYVQGVEAPSLVVTNAVFDGQDKLTVVSFDFSASAGVDAFRLGMTGGTGNWGITRLAVFHGEKTDDEEALLREFAQQLPVPDNLMLTGLASSSLSLSAFTVADAVGYCFELTRLTGCPRTEVREDFVDAPNLSSGWTCDAKTEGLTLSDGGKNYSYSAAGDEHALKVDKATNPKEGPVELGLVSPLSPEPISEWSFVGRFGTLDKSNYFVVYGRTDASAGWTELATGLTPDKQQSNKLFSGTVDTALNIHQIRFVLAANADSWTATGLDSLCVVYGGNEERELVSAQTNSTPTAEWRDLVAGRYGYRVKALGATEGERQFKDSVWSEEQTVDLDWADVRLSPPENLAFAVAGDQLNLSWTPVATADRYEVTVALADDPENPVATLVVKGASASVRISELGEYVVTVTAVSPGGVSTATSSLENCTVALGKVTELAVSATAADTIAATWKEVPLAESYQAKLFKVTGEAKTEVASVGTKECAATYRGLDKTAKYVVVVTPQPSEGGELGTSSDVVDLAQEYFRPTGPVSLRSCRWLYQEDFSSLSNVTKEADLAKVPLAHWQFFKGTGEAETIFYTSGTNSTRGGVYCYSDAERSPDSFMIGTVASSTIGSSLGIAFVNDTGAVAVVTNLTFRPVQRNIKAKSATYALEYLVTDGTWSIGTQSDAWHPLAIPMTAPKTADCPETPSDIGTASVTVSLADGDQPLRLHQGQVIIFRWRHEKMSSGPMMGIDDVRVEFRNANGLSMIIR